MRLRTLLLLLALTAAPQAPCWSQPLPDSPEFQVNATTANVQYHPVVGTFESGGFVVVWASTNQDGDSQGVFARRFDGSGAPLDPGEIQVNSYITGKQSNPAVALAPNGDFLVAWISTGQTLTEDVYARRFSSSGAPLDPAEFLVNTYTPNHQNFISAAFAGSGDFTVVWQSAEQNSPHRHVYARRYDSSANPLDPVEFRVNSDPESGAYHPTIGMAESGEFVVVWHYNYYSDQYMTRFHILGRRFDSGGNPLDPGDLRLNSDDRDPQDEVSAAMSSTGEFAAVWQSFGRSSGKYRILGRRFDSSGNPLDMNELVVARAPEGTRLVDPFVGMAHGGSFVVAWEDVKPDTNEHAVMARRYDSIGKALDGKGFQVNASSPAYDWADPSVAISPAGGFVVTWSSLYLDGDNWGISARTYSCADPECARGPQ